MSHFDLLFDLGNMIQDYAWTLVEKYHIESIITDIWVNVRTISVDGVPEGSVKCLVMVKRSISIDTIKNITNEFNEKYPKMIFSFN